MPKKSGFYSMLWHRPIHQRQEKIHFFKAIRPLRLLQLSDLHLGFSTRLLKELKAPIYELRPDFIVLTGDYYDLPYGAGAFFSFVRELCQKYTVLFIWGNHDAWYGQRLKQTMYTIDNCICVESEPHTYISPEGLTYTFAPWHQRHILKDEPGIMNIILMHNPEKLVGSELGKVHLVLAGHLHGGQVVLYKTKDNRHYPGSLLYRYCRDSVVVANTTIIVSRGLGDTLPLRWNCPKEIVVIDIY